MTPELRERIQHAANLLELYLPPDVKRGRFLDIGCGAGNAVVAAAEMGFKDAAGIDIDLSRFAWAERTDVRLIEGDVLTADLPRQSFDCVTMIDSIEHVPTPERFIARAAELVAPGGVVIIDCGALFYSRPGHHLWGYFPVDKYPWVHLWPEFEELVAQHKVDDWSIREFRRLNRATHDDLLGAMRAAKLEITLEHRSGEKPGDRDVLAGVRDKLVLPVEERCLFEDWMLLVARRRGATPRRRRIMETGVHESRPSVCPSVVCRMPKLVPSLPHMDDKLEARLARIEAALARIEQLTYGDRATYVAVRVEAALARIEQLTHGARATYVGAGRVLTRATFPDFHLGFLVQGNDRLLAPALIVNGVYEAEITNHFLRTVKPSDHCIDVGANFGYYTCLMGRLAHSGRTTGIEPDPETFELLRDNIYINYLERCTTGLHGAASNADGTLTLHRRITRSGNTSIVQPVSEALQTSGEAPSEEFQAEAFRLDKLLDAMNGRVDHIKIDVEGAEPLVLGGMQRTLAINPQLTIVMEWSPGQIQGAGFDLNTFVDQMRTAKLKPSVIGPAGPTAISFEDLVTSNYLTGVLLTR